VLQMRRSELQTAGVRLTVLLLAAGSLACAPAHRVGDEVNITEESAIIVWDAASKTEHFIRRAAFKTTARDFGFLVPTPTVPKLDEADDSAFAYLAKLTAPKVVWRWDSGDGPPPPAPFDEERKEENVRVIETKKVGAYDAVILEASNANELDGWLKGHGYASSPELVDWYKPLIAQKWKITAFKISKVDGGDRASASAVKMSFITDRAFFPYREPVAATPRRSHWHLPRRSLRLFFIADGRYAGGIGTTRGWPGETVWSGIMDNDSRTELLGMLRLPGMALVTTPRLTEFEDLSDPRPGTDDLFFGQAGDQATVRRPNVVRWISLGDLIGALMLALLAAGILYGVWKLSVKILRFIRAKST